LARRCPRNRWSWPQGGGIAADLSRGPAYSDAILFFDEADALFGKPSEVKDANDHFAKIETARLLQRTETLLILASNLKK